MVRKGIGSCKNRTSAVWATTKPLTTQQITVDRSVVHTMRAAVGSCKNSGSGQRL